MSWFTRKIAKWSETGRRELNRDEDILWETSNTKMEIGSDSEEETYFKNPLNITLYNAIGGRIVKFHSYDSKTDRKKETIYLIRSDENVEEALAKFIALETLKHVE